jgi:sensor histidine kinase YesM
MMNPNQSVIVSKPILAVGIMIPLAGTFALLYYWFGFDWKIASLDAGLSVFLLLTAMVAVRSVLQNYFPQSGKFFYAIGLNVVLAAFITYVFQQAISRVISDAAYLDFLSLAMPVRFAFYVIFLLSISAISLMYGLFREKQLETKHESDTATMIREAELQKLQLQLQPHFLFNSLNSINALILIQPPRAREMVQQLSDFLRATLKRADEHWITLEQELNYLNLYLSIEKVRFGHRLEVQTEVDEQIKLWLIPPLLLQPLVENAIKFGLYGTTEKVVIQMITQRVGNSLQITISNPFDSDMQPQEGSGFGLQGLRRRLYLLYARNDLIQTEVINNHFTVQLTLPEKL